MTNCVISFFFSGPCLLDAEWAGAHSASSSSREVGAASEGIAAAARSSRAMEVEWEELQAPPEQAPAQAQAGAQERAKRSAAERSLSLIHI